MKLLMEFLTSPANHSRAGPVSFRQRSGNNQPLFLRRLDGLLIQIVGRLGHKPSGLCSQNIRGAKFFYIVQAYACYFAKEVLHVPSIPQSISVADLIAICIMTCNLCSCFVRRNFGCVGKFSWIGPFWFRLVKSCGIFSSACAPFSKRMVAWA